MRSKQMRAYVQIGVLALNVLFLAGTPAYAAVQTVEVLAEVTGNSPQDAKNKSIDYAQKRAFFMVLSKFAPEKAAAIAGALTSEQVYQHVRGYELANELIDGNRYVALYRISISDDMIRRMLAEGATEEAQSNNPILIIPVLEDAGKTYLWEAENLWRSVWNAAALQQGEGLLIMPYGDPDDKSIADSSTILTYNFDTLAPMAARYGAGEVAVLVARYETERTPQGVSITMRRMGPGIDKMKTEYFEVSDAAGAAQSVLPQAAQAVAEQLKDVARNYVGDQERKIAEASKIKLMAQFRRVSEWAKLQETLKKLPRVVRLEVDGITIDHANATLFYNGEAEAMRAVMLANGLHISEQGDGVWLVSLN